MPDSLADLQQKALSGSVPQTITGNVGITGTPNINIAASTSVPGSTPAKIASPASTAVAGVKASNTKVYGILLGNTSAAWRYFRIYNTAVGNVTPGVTSPNMIIPIPPGGQVTAAFTVPISINNGFSWNVTTGAADLDNTAPAVANEVIGSIQYA